jgi:hypothetical protein
MALPAAGQPISFGDINDELGNSTTATLDLKDASIDLGETAAPYGMDELAGISFSNVTPTFTTDLTATNAGLTGEGKIKTDWVVNLDPTGTQGGESFILKRSVNSNMSSATNVSTTNDDTQTITGLTAGTLHYFQATGTNDAGSTNSSIVNARATDLASFTSFTATTNNDGAGKINLAWEIDNGHPSSLSSFSLKRSVNSNMASATEISTTNDGTEALSSLTAGVTYYFQITINNGVGAVNSSIVNAVASSAPTINSFAATRSETVAGRIDLAWNISAGTDSLNSILVTRKAGSQAGAGDTSVTTNNDGSEAVTGLGQGNAIHFYLQAVNDNGTTTALANATTRPAPTIDTFTVAGGSGAGEIDITYATTEADTVTLKEDNTNNGSFETTILDGSSTVDGSQTRTGLTATNSHNYQLTATGAGSVVATDDAFPTANTSWTNSVSQINLVNNNGKKAQVDTMTSAIQSIQVNNPSGNTRVEILTNAEGADLQVRWNNLNTGTGMSAYSDDITNIPSSVTTIYYQLKWTEKTEQTGVYSPGTGMFDDGTFARSVGKLDQTFANAIRWTNNSVTNNTTDVDCDFFNDNITEFDLP